MTFDEMRDHAQIYLTAGTLTYFVWSVCRQERIRTRLVERLRAHLAAQGVQGLDFTYEHIKGSAYLEGVIKETLRLFPAVPHGMPQVVLAGGAMTTTTTTLGGYYYLPEGTNVAAQAWSLHRNQGAWGADADDFVPERWENATKTMRDSFLPFGGGSRSCLGVHLQTCSCGLPPRASSSRFRRPRSRATRA